MNEEQNLRDLENFCPPVYPSMFINNSAYSCRPFFLEHKSLYPDLESFLKGDVHDC